MNCLVSNGILEQYRPLADIKGSYSAQFEHVGFRSTFSPVKHAAHTHCVLRLSCYARRTKRFSVAETTIDTASSPDAAAGPGTERLHPHSVFDSPHRLKVW